DYITIKHGPIQQPYDFNKVLTEIINFLKNNPSETVLLQLKQESSEWDEIDYARVVDKYINNSKYHNYFHLDQGKLNFGEVRGKVVLINRFYDNQHYGINVKDWPDDKLFSKDNGVVK